MKENIKIKLIGFDNKESSLKNHHVVKKDPKLFRELKFVIDTRKDELIVRMLGEKRIPLYTYTV